jgi:hypothetical protein
MFERWGKAAIVHSIAAFFETTWAKLKGNLTLKPY